MTQAASGAGPAIDERYGAGANAERRCGAFRTISDTGRARHRALLRRWAIRVRHPGPVDCQRARTSAGSREHM